MRVMLTAVLTTMSALVPVQAKTPEPQPAANIVVCNKYCDDRAADQASGDRIAVTAPLDDRVLQLHFADGDPMGWAVVDHSRPGDQVWLDRSFDGGATWDGGAQLGRTTAPSGVGGWRTQMYNNDDWNTRGVGACARAAARSTPAGSLARLGRAPAGTRRTARKRRRPR